jgi:hypothetical protein
MRVFLFLSLLGLVCVELRAQDPIVPGSRAEEIENEQAAKAQHLNPDLPDLAAMRAKKIEKTAKKLFRGTPVHLQLGGLPMGTTFGLGPVFEWANPTDRVRASIWGIGSIEGFYNAGTAITLPRVTSQRLNFRFEASHHDSPQFDFYGVGAGSLKADRTNYRREDTLADFNVEWPVVSHFSPNCGVEQDFLNIGPGTNSLVTTTNLKFSEDQVPGVDVQTNYLSAGCTLPLDFRDNPEYPHRGTALFLHGHRAYAQNHSQFSFNRVSAAAEQYIPFFNQKRVIVLRGDTQFSIHNANQIVPFYMQPTLGGYDDLRGFRPRRFYDENSIVLNAEYRWEICTGFDMAIFEDMGKVFHRPGDIDLKRLQKSTGFGLRFNDQRNMAFRIDTGFSREGFQVWLTFDRVF